MSDRAAAMRVLVIDDEALIRWSIAEKLASHGYTATEADDAASAIKALNDGDAKPEVIFLDYRLPDSKDLELLRHIRQIAPTSAVIMMTAFGTPDMFKEAIELGAYRVLTKPFDVLQLPELADSARRARH
jgi:two-component system, NtrC family, response regulator AtoC